MNYHLFYFGMHQPRYQYFSLTQGVYHIDIIDTWNMTVDRFADAASGDVRVELPRKKFLAIRIEKNT